MQHTAAQQSTAQHSTAQHSTAQHSTAQHSTAQHRLFTIKETDEPNIVHQGIVAGVLQSSPQQPQSISQRAADMHM